MSLFIRFFLAFYLVSSYAYADEEIIYCPEIIICYADFKSSCWAKGISGKNVWSSVLGSEFPPAGDYTLAEVGINGGPSSSTGCTYSYYGHALSIYTRVKLEPYTEDNDHWSIMDEDAYCSGQDTYDCPLLYSFQ